MISFKKFVCTYIITALECLLKGSIIGIIVFVIYCGLTRLENMQFHSGAIYSIQMLYAVFFIVIAWIYRKIYRFDFQLFLYLGVLLGILLKIHVINDLIQEVRFNYMVLSIGLLFLPVVSVFATIWWIMQKYHPNVGEDSFFDDQAIENEQGDLLNIKEKAKKFAQKVCGQNFNSSLIYAIEGPWGVGKTSFLNLCKKQFHDEKLKVFHFSVLKYSQSQSILSSISNELINAMISNTKNPMLHTLLVQYNKLVNKISFNVMGLTIQLYEKSQSQIELFALISSLLVSERKRIIVIIDDLDRLNGEEVYKVLFAIKCVFNMPGVSYILCYDMENLCQGNDSFSTKNIEFLQKFIQVKMSLFLDKENILNIINDKEMFRQLKGHTNFDEEAVKTILRELNCMLNGPDGYKYYFYLGNLRAVKRLINTILLLDIQRVDFPNYDFNGRSLVNLLLLYIMGPVSRPLKNFLSVFLNKRILD